MATASNIPSVQAVLDGLQYRSAQIEVGNTNDLGHWVTELKNAKTDTSRDIAFLFKMNSTPVRIGFGVLYNGGTEARVFATDGNLFYRAQTNMDEKFVWEELGHGDLNGRDEPDQHPIDAITGLADALGEYVEIASIRETDGKKLVVTDVKLRKAEKESVTIRMEKSDVETGTSHDYDFTLPTANENYAGLMGASHVAALKKIRDDFDDAIPKIKQELIKLWAALTKEEGAREAADKLLNDSILEEARLARMEEAKLLAKILLEAKRTDEELSKKIDKDAIRVSGNNRQQVLTAVNFKIGAEDAEVDLYSSDVVSKIHDVQKATIPAATTVRAGLLSSFDKVKVDGAVQRKDIDNQKVLTGANVTVGEETAHVVFNRSDVNDGSKSSLNYTVPAASDTHAGLMTKNDKIEQKRIADEVTELKEEISDRNDFLDDEIQNLKDEDERLDGKIGDLTEDSKEWNSVTEWNLALTKRLKAEEDTRTSEVERLDGRIDDEIDRATEEEARIEEEAIKKMSIRESEGVRKVMTALTTKVQDDHTAEVTEWNSSVEGAPGQATFTINTENGISLKQNSRDSIRISGEELEDQILAAETEAKTYAKELVDEEAEIRESTDEELRAMIEDETARAELREDEIEENAFQKASIPTSGNGRQQLLTAIDLTVDNSGPVQILTGHQFSVDKEGVTKQESMVLPNANKLQTGLMTNEEWEYIHSREAAITSTANDEKYPTSKAVRDFVLKTLEGVGQYEGTYDYVGKKADIDALVLTGPEFELYALTAISLDGPGTPFKFWRGNKLPGAGWAWTESEFPAGAYVFGRRTAGTNLGNSGMAIMNKHGQFEYREDRERIPDQVHLTFNDKGELALKTKRLPNGAVVLNGATASNLEYTPDKTVSQELADLSGRITSNKDTIELYKNQATTAYNTLKSEVKKNREDMDATDLALKKGIEDVRKDGVTALAAARLEAKNAIDALKVEASNTFTAKARAETVTAKWTFKVNPILADDSRAVSKNELDLYINLGKAVEARVTGLEGRVDSVEQRLDDVESDIVSLENHVDAEVSRLDGRIDDVETDIVTINGKITGLTGDLSTVQGKITILEGKTSNLELNKIDTIIPGDGMSLEVLPPDGSTIVKRIRLNTSGLVQTAGSQVITGPKEFTQPILAAMEPGGSVAAVVTKAVVKDLPAAQGRYVLGANRSGGGITYGWVLIETDGTMGALI